MQTALWHFSQCGAHCVQRVTGVAIRFEYDRIACREPADRTRQVDVIEDVLAAMAFEFHQHPWLRTALRQRTGECGQQQDFGCETGAAGSVCAVV
ncbi:hypothetical protein LMG22931_07737 [Paraburkholderia nemoris]|nr:hypothetical protein LMG22931_07737 [Paraburkholderia nemoris]